MDSGDDWDLAAVVRGCCSRARPAATAADPLLPSIFAVAREEERGEKHIPANHYFPDFLSRSRNFNGLEKLYSPFLFRQITQQQEQKQQQAEDSLLGVGKRTHRPGPMQSPRSKRK